VLKRAPNKNVSRKGLAAGGGGKEPRNKRDVTLSRSTRRKVAWGGRQNVIEDQVEKKATSRMNSTNPRTKVEKIRREKTLTGGQREKHVPGLVCKNPKETSEDQVRKKKEPEGDFLGNNTNNKTKKTLTNTKKNGPQHNKNPPEGRGVGDPRNTPGICCYTEAS